MVAGLLHQRPAQVVAAHAAVPVGEAGAGRDDEGRVGDDQVERVGAHRLEEGALAQVGGGGAGQGEGEPGELQGTGVEVGGGDPGRVLGGVQRLDAGARTEVEGRGDRCPDGDPGEGGGGPADPEDDALIARADTARTADRAPEVGHDEPVLAVRPPYGRTSTPARTVPSAWLTQPSATHSASGRAARARSSATGRCNRNSRTSVSSGVSPRVARRAGTVSLRARAA